MKIITALLILLYSTFLHAIEDRWINFEWDPVPEAKSYEIELFQQMTNNKFSLGIYKAEIPEWNKAVNPGKYFIRIRSLDSRNVPGEWSGEVPLSVKSPPPIFDHPSYDQKIQIIKNENNIIQFSWTPKNNINLFRFQLFNNSGKVVHSEVLNTTQLSFPINESGSYSWNVSSLTDENEETEPGLKTSPFNVSYGKLGNTEFTTSNSDKSIVVNWIKIDNASSYTVSFFLQNKDLAFKPIFKKEFTENYLTIPKNKIFKGVYKITVVSHAKGYEDSEESEIIYEYDLKEVKIIVDQSGSVSPYEVRKSYRNEVEAYGAVPSLKYQFKNYETDTIGNQSLSGTSLDLSFKIPFKSFESEKIIVWNNNLKVMSLADLYASSLFINFQSTLEYLYSKNKLKLYLLAGISYEKTPAFVISRLDTSQVVVKNYSTIGPVFGLKETYPYTLDLNFFSTQKINYNALNISTLTENKGLPTLGFEFDFGGKYFFKKNLDIIGKLTYKNQGYNSQARIASDSYATSGDKNALTFSGIIWSAGVSWYY